MFKRKYTITIVVTAFLIAVLAWFVMYRNSFGGNPVIQSVPKEATHFILIQPTELILDKKRVNVTLKDSLFNRFRNSKYFKHVEDFTKLGLNPLKGIAVFEYKKVWCLAVPVYKKSLLEDFIRNHPERIFSNVVLGRGMNSCELNNSRITFMWNSSFLYAIDSFRGNQNTMMQKLNDLKTSESMESNSKFVALMKDNNHAISVFSMGLFNESGSKNLVAFGDFKGMELQFQGMIFDQFPVGPISGFITEYSEAENIPFRMSFHPSDNLASKIGREILSSIPLPFYSGWNNSGGLLNTVSSSSGPVDLRYYGMIGITDTLVTYEFDDNFNKMPVRRMFYDTIADLELRFQPKDIGWEKEFKKAKRVGYITDSGVVFMSNSGKYRKSASTENRFELHFNSKDEVLLKFYMRGIDRINATLGRAGNKGQMFTFAIAFNNELISSPIVNKAIHDKTDRRPE